MYTTEHRSSDDASEIINNFNQTNISKIILNNQVDRLSNALNSGFKVASGKY